MGSVLVDIERRIKEAEWNRYGFILLSALIWGFAAHGFGFFNKSAWGDDIASIFWGLGNTYGLGRWMLGVLERVFIIVFGSNGSNPYVNGMGVVLCIGWIACMFSDMLDIKDKISLFVMSGVLVSMPVVVGTFAFFFTAFAYFIGTALCVLAVYLVLGSGRADKDFVDVRRISLLPGLFPGGGVCFRACAYGKSAGD